MNYKATIEILRPVNGIMGSLTVVIGILNTRVGIPSEILALNIILGILTYFFISGSGMIINDIYDYEIDKINRPERPLPSGRLDLKNAKILFILTFSIGILLSIIHCIILSLNFYPVILVIGFGLLGWVYAAWGKRKGFIGNIIVSVSFSIGLIYGAILNSFSIPSYIFYFFITSFALLMAREIVKGCEDIEGDKKEGVKTLAITIGIKKTMIIAIIFECLAIIFFILPLFTNIINPNLFIILMFPGIAIVGFSLIYSFYHHQNIKNFGRISLLLKIGAFAGLLAFIFASL
ncbi:MAG: geranylgeranylglycerol-phosphate geranylgeranyltransferase [Promethearchaeota archaeon]